MSAAKLCEALEYLMQVKEHKDIIGKDDWYNLHQPLAWKEARQAVEDYKFTKSLTIKHSPHSTNTGSAISMKEIQKRIKKL